MVFLLLLLLFNTYHHHHHNTSIIRSIIYRRHRRWYLLLLSLLFWMIKRMDGWMNECKDRVWSNDFFFVDEHCVSGMNRSLYRLFNWKWIGGTMSSFFFLFPLTLSFVVVVVAGNQWSWCFSIWWNGSNRIVFMINLGHQTKKKHRANNNSFSSYLWWQWWWWSQSWPVFIKMYGVVSIIIMFKIIEWKLMGGKKWKYTITIIGCSIDCFVRPMMMMMVLAIGNDWLITMADDLPWFTWFDSIYSKWKWMNCYRDWPPFRSSSSSSLKINELKYFPLLFRRIFTKIKIKWI